MAFACTSPLLLMLSWRPPTEAAKPSNSRPATTASRQPSHGRSFVVLLLVLGLQAVPVSRRLHLEGTQYVAAWSWSTWGSRAVVEERGRDPHGRFHVDCGTDLSVNQGLPAYPLCWPAWWGFCLICPSSPSSCPEAAGQPTKLVMVDGKRVCLGRCNLQPLHILRATQWRGGGNLEVLVTPVWHGPVHPTTGIQRVQVTKKKSFCSRKRDHSTEPPMPFPPVCFHPCTSVFHYEEW